MMLTLDTSTLSNLESNSNLLAFSAGVDSTALFFLLLEKGIVFDIALVNYGMRSESDEEESYAKELAKRYNLKCYTAKAPKFVNHFEQQAREFRYDFFESLIKKYDYKNLITAHQLNDQLEWLLMRLTKGAGVVELIGLQSATEHSNYTTLRPILHHSKKELLGYLKAHNIRYYVDSSNSDEYYERNYIRKQFSDKLIDEYQEGILKSFDYLNKDKQTLLDGYHEVLNINALYIIAFESESVIVRVVDRYLKRLGYLLSAAQRHRLLSEKSLVFGGKWAVEILNDKIFIAPYVILVIPKQQRERYRIEKIPPKVRGYCYQNRIYTLINRA